MHDKPLVPSKFRELVTLFPPLTATPSIQTSTTMNRCGNNNNDNSSSNNNDNSSSNNRDLPVIISSILAAVLFILITANLIVFFVWFRRHKRKKWTPTQIEPNHTTTSSSNHEPLSASVTGIETTTNEAYLPTGIPVDDNPAYQTVERDSVPESLSLSYAYPYY